MKKLGILAGFVGLLTAVAVKAETVDFKAVNPVMAALAEGAIAADENVDWVYPHFDEGYSDLKKERLKYDLKGKIKDTPWSEGGRADVVGSSTYAADRALNHTGVVVKFSAQGRTDTLALIRYSGALALAKVHDLAPKYEARIKAHLQRLAVVRSLDELPDLLTSGQNLAKEMLVDQSAHVQKYLDCLMHADCHDPADPYLQASIASTKKKLENWERIRKQTSAVSVSTGKDSAGRVASVRLASESIDSLILEGDHPLLIGRSMLTFSADTVGLENESFYRLTQERLDSVKKDFEAKLKGVQEGNLEDRKSVQETYKQALSEFKGVLRAKNIH